MNYTPWVILTVVLVLILIVLLRFDVTVKNDKVILTNDRVGGLRTSCLKCVRKHIGQARALLDESQLGYKDHFYLALGHLAEAESESIRSYPSIAKQIREVREDLYSGKDADLMELFKMVDTVEKDKKS